MEKVIEIHSEYSPIHPAGSLLGCPVGHLFDFSIILAATCSLMLVYIWSLHWELDLCSHELISLCMQWCTEQCMGKGPFREILWLLRRN